MLNYNRILVDTLVEHRFRQIQNNALRVWIFSMVLHVLLMAFVPLIFNNPTTEEEVRRLIISSYLIGAFAVNLFVAVVVGIWYWVSKYRERKNESRMSDEGATRRYNSV